MIEHVRLSSDPTVKTVFSEDTAALIGLLLAALGLGLHQLTGQAFWDGSAAIAIGVLLAVVAYLLGRDTKEMLIGEPRRRRLRDGIRRELADHPEVERVVDVRTMLLGPNLVLVAARLDMDDALGAADVEDSTDAIAAGLREKFPQVREVYLDVTAGRDGQVAETSPGGEQHEQQQPEADPVDDEQHEGVPGDEPQQPGHREVPTTKLHHGRDDRRRPAHPGGDVVGRRVRLQDAGRGQRRHREHERQPGHRDPVEPAQQAGGHRRAGPGHARHRATLGQPMISVSRQVISLSPSFWVAVRSA
jgi:Predicted Co/Zn/Cd cation transporters